MLVDGVSSGLMLVTLVRLLDAAVTIVVVLTVTAGIWFARLVRKWRQNRLSKYTAL